MNRRGFLGSILALGAAPAIVRADSLMRIVPLDTTIVRVPGFTALNPADWVAVIDAFWPDMSDPFGGIPTRVVYDAAEFRRRFPHAAARLYPNGTPLADMEPSAWAHYGSCARAEIDLASAMRYPWR